MRKLIPALIVSAVMAVPVQICTASAQAPDHGPRESAPSRPDPSRPGPPGPEGAPQPPGATEARPDPGGDALGAGPAGPDSASPRRRSSLDRLPQTAEEKARALADLYAHLATAEDEAQAKRWADRIERIWMLSGSDTVGLLMERATRAIQAKQPERAMRFLNLVIELAPDFAEGFNRRAYLHFTQGNFQAAVGDLRRVLALDPNHFKALEGLAQIWRETGDKKGALRVMQQLLDVHPHAPNARATHDELKREVDGQGI